MLSRWPIRYKLLLGVTALFFIVVLLSFISFKGVYSFRELARSISWRAAELPASADLVQSVAELRYAFKRAGSRRQFNDDTYDLFDVTEWEMKLANVKAKLHSYREQLDQVAAGDSRMGNKQNEREDVAEIEKTLERISKITHSQDFILDPGRWTG